MVNFHSRPSNPKAPAHPPYPQFHWDQAAHLYQEGVGSAIHICSKTRWVSGPVLESRGLSLLYSPACPSLFAPQWRPNCRPVECYDGLQSANLEGWPHPRSCRPPVPPFTIWQASQSRTSGCSCQDHSVGFQNVCAQGPSPMLGTRVTLVPL
jgi:hypothetical protein